MNPVLREGCGTHLGLRLHQAAGEPPCPECLRGEGVRRAEQAARNAGVLAEALREDAREFVLELADSGQLALSDWEETVAVEPLEVSDADAAAARRRRAEELCAPLRDLTPEQWRDVLILIGAEKRKRLRAALADRPVPPETP